MIHEGEFLTSPLVFTFRLRDELRRIEETAPANLSTSTAGPALQQDISAAGSLPGGTAAQQGRVSTTAQEGSFSVPRAAPAGTVHSSTVTTVHRGALDAHQPAVVVSTSTNISTAK